MWMTRTKIFYSLAFAFLLVVVGIPHVVHAAGSFFLSPNVGSYTVGSTITVRLVVGTGGQAINSGQATITFPTSTLEAQSVSKSGSIFTLWPEDPRIVGDTVTFAGGLPTPGYNGSGGLIITATFRATATGTATVRVTSGRLLLNDGSGTNILTGFGSATYTITPAPPAKNTPAAPTVSSSSHSDQNLWYANSNPTFDWTHGDGVTGFSYSFDDQEGAIPDEVQDSTLPQASYAGTKDGFWYFHVRARNDDGWGATGHFTVRIDTTAPLPFEIFALLDEEQSQDATRQIAFKTTDAVSGLDHYDVYVDGLHIEQLQPAETVLYTLPDLPQGTHTILVRAVDRAGNRTDASVNVGAARSCPRTGFQIGSLSTWCTWIVVFQWLIILLLILFILALLNRRNKQAPTTQNRKHQHQSSK